MSWIRRNVFKSKIHENAFCVEFSLDDRIIATASFDGNLVGYDASTGSTKFEIDLFPGEQERSPIMSFKFRPLGGRDIVLVGCSNGNVLHVDPRSLHVTSTLKEENNEIYTVAYRRDGHSFATAGRDRHVRIYDENTETLLRTFTKGNDMQVNAMATRIYAVKWTPMNENVLVSGGWENTICVWDMRVDTHHGLVGEMYGPYICGESLDISGNTIMTASHRLEERIQLWDLANMKKIRGVPWPSQVGDTMPLCGRFSREGTFIATGGGSGVGLKNLGVVIDANTDNLCLELTTNKAINTVALANHDPLVAFGDGSGFVHLFERRNRPQATGMVKS